MNTKTFFLRALLFAVMVISLGAHARTKSYAAYQILTQGPYGVITDIPQNQSVWVEWSSDNETISLGDGTIWKYIGDYNGNHHYTYSGNNGIEMPNTQYNQVVFSSDYTTFSMYFSFGMMGMVTPMRSDWQYIGEGTQPAYEWMTKTF